MDKYLEGDSHGQLIYDFRQKWPENKTVNKESAR
jgi:hypothetical protein